MDLEAYATDYGTLFYRPDTSDLKAIQEVCDKRGYQRRGFAIEAGEQWLDLGANVGSFCIYAGSKGALITGFEPDPVHFEILSKNVRWNNLNESVQVINAAAACRSGSAVFYQNTAKGNTWRNSLLKEWKGGDTVQVELVDIRKFIQPGVCLKIDIEGAEKEVLAGLMSAGLMQYVPKLVFEWSFDILPLTRDFIDVIEGLRATHNLMGVTEGYVEKLSQHATYPLSWFPPCAKVFGVRK